MTLSNIILLEKSWDVLKEDLIMTGGIKLPILGVSNNANVWVILWDSPQKNSALFRLVL